MAEEVKGQAQFRDFPGLVLDMDPLDIMAGAGRRQENAIPFSGTLSIRKGLAVVRFELVVDVT